MKTLEKSDLDKSIQYIKGVGPKRFQTLKRLGIHTVRDLLYYFPRTYQDRSQIEKISGLEKGITSMVKGKVFNVKSYNTRGWRNIFDAWVVR